MMSRLKAQGVDASNISLFDGGEDNNNKGFGSGPKSLSALTSGSRKPTAAAPAGARPSTAPSAGVGQGRPSIRPADTMNLTLASPARPSTASTAAPANRPGKGGKEPDFGLQSIIQKLKTEIRSRGGTGFIALQRKFRIIDDDGDGNLNVSEFKKSMREMNINLSDSELRILFEYFDSDHSGTVNFEEFIQGVRDPLTDRRLRIVNMAFDALDSDRSGVIEANELMEKYDASKHPDVIAGRRTAQQVLNEWLSTFEVGGAVDGCVTRQEFVNYYTNIGANIDNEDYFELMIRNAWHISGGEGQAANSANRRVLATRDDGSQYVEEIKNDLGLRADDKAGMMSRLRAQNANVSQISLFGGGSDGIQDNYRPGSAPSLSQAAAGRNAGAGSGAGNNETPRVAAGVKMHHSNVIFGDDSKPAPRPSTSAGSANSAQVCFVFVFVNYFPF
jgi:Ca2+-binding EF-hand superfamily protein